jgi:hypothetical protein
MKVEANALVAVALKLQRLAWYRLVAESEVQRHTVNLREVQREHGLRPNLLACTYSSLACGVSASSNCNPSSTIRGTLQTQRMTRTEHQSNRQRTSVAPETLRVNLKKPVNMTSMAVLLAHVGLTPYKMTAEEAHFTETPWITWHTLTKKLNARSKTEWQECNKILGYSAKKFLFAHPHAQPYVATAPGEPGLILRPATMTSQDDDRTFQVFSSTPDGRNLFRYCGEYTAVHNVTIEFKWADLPVEVRI